MINQQTIIATVVNKDGRTFLESDKHPGKRIFFKFQWLRERGNIPERAEVGDKFEIIVQTAPNGFGLEVARFINKVSAKQNNPIKKNERTMANGFEYTPIIDADNNNFALFINKPPQLLVTPEWGLKSIRSRIKR